MQSISSSNIEFLLLECISDSLIGVDKEMTPIYANKAAESMFGFSDINEIIGNGLYSIFEDKNAQMMQEKITRSITQKKPFHFEIPIGEFDVTWHDVHVYPSDEGAVIILRDITAKRKVENTIAKQNKKLRLLSDAANHILLKSEPGELLDALFKELAGYLDLDVYINYMFNEKTQRLELMHYQGIDQSTAEDIHYLDLGEAVCGCVARDCVRIVEEKIDESIHSRVYLVKELGIKAYACYPLLTGGKTLGTLSFGSRTRSSFTEEELDLLQTICSQVASMLERVLMMLELKKKKEEAETANTVKNNFLSMMSHELRTPLNSIIGFTQILQDDVRDPLTHRQNQKVSKILNSSRHLLNLINELLELVKRNESNPVSKKESISVERIVQEPLRIIQPQVKEKQIRIHDHSHSYSYIHVLADSTRVNQVMLNLLENAVKYSPTRGEIMISCNREGNNIKFTVTDNGDGIATHEHENVFQPFYRIFNQENNIEGTGIGLTIVKQLVLQMGGEIGLISDLGCGSSFWFTLPIDSKFVSRGTWDSN
jgi:PAS domain S-box-containing protein